MTIFSGVGASASVGPTSGGKFYAFNAIAAAPQTVAPANPSRVTITFWNPSNVTIFIAPLVVISLVGGGQQALIPSLAALGGCIPLLSQSWISITGECQGAFQALAASGSTNALT